MGGIWYLGGYERPTWKAASASLCVGRVASTVASYAVAGVLMRDLLGARVWYLGRPDPLRCRNTLALYHRSRRFRYPDFCYLVLGALE